MKKVFSIILLLMIIFISSNTAIAIQPPHYTNIFSQGLYLVSKKMEVLNLVSMNFH